MVWNRSIRLYSVRDQRGCVHPIEFMVWCGVTLPSWSSVALFTSRHSGGILRHCQMGLCADVL